MNAGPSDAYRFNWNTPFLLSPHNPSIVWLGGNRLFKSYNRGDTWVASADLTKQVDRNTVTMMGAPGDRTQLSKNDGVVAYSTIIAVSESPVMPGVVWAGTDDGNVQVSRDDGLTFTEVGKNMPGLPANHPYWISRDRRVALRRRRRRTCGRRPPQRRPEAVRLRDARLRPDVAEHRQQPAGVSATCRWCARIRRTRTCSMSGTEFGLFVSLDGGKQWEKFMNNYPTVRTDDILVHPRDGDLIVATHGRSIWIADDITPLQQLTPAVRDARTCTLFDIRPAVSYLNDQQSGPAGRRAEGVRRRERAARHDDQLLPEVGGDRRREDHDRRRQRAHDPRRSTARRTRASTA